MKKNWIGALLMLLYCIPWTYFALLGDAQFGTMLMYAVMLAAHAALCASAAKLHHAWIAPVGGLLSGFVSLLCTKFGALAEMGWYFKPFTAVQLAAAVSFALFAVQAGAAVLAVRKEKTKDC